MTLSNDLNQTKIDVENWLGDPWDLTSNTPLNNLAFNRPTTASSLHSSFNLEDEAVDNGDGTRWESQHGSDNEWIYVDLGASYFINTAVILWENSYSSVYDIQVSNDAVNWTTVYSDTNADGGLDVVNLNDVNGQYLRINGLDRATPYGHSIYELKVYGSSTLSVEENVLLESQISVYPNPVTNGNLNISFNSIPFDSSSSIDLQIVNTNGQVVFEKSYSNLNNNQPLSIDINSLTNGIYFLRLLSDEGIYVDKIIKSN